MTSLEIKYAVMYYFRFKRQWICASECLQNDVMAIAGNEIIEVEIKISKYDLWKGEAKKYKHKILSNSASPHWRLLNMPNKFYICIPISLEEEAKKWVEQTNKKYGIIRYNPNCHYNFAISIAKIAQVVKEGFDESLKEKVMRRVCAENIGLLWEKVRYKDENK